MGIFKLIRAFRKVNGRSPTPSELAKLKQQAEEMSTQENVIPFPGGGKDRRSPFDDFKASEDAYEQSQKLTPSRIKGGISTKIKLNGPNENKQYAKDLIGGKSAEYNSLKPEDRKELLDLLEAQIKKDTNPIGPPIDPDDMPFADGGRAGFNVGGLSKLLKMLQGKVGKKNITTADKIARPESALNREMFGEFNERVNRKILDVPSMPGGFQLSREKLLKNFPELDEAMADEIMGLDKELQGRVLTMLKDRRKNPDAYDKLLMEKGDTLDFQGEFDRSVKRSKNAAGGLAGLLGEEPRSEYGAGGGAGAPAVTYGEGINIPGSPKGIPTGKIGPVDIGVYGGGGYGKNQEVPGVNRATTNQNFGITAEMPIGDSGFSVGGNYMKSRTNERFTGDLIPGQTFKNVPIDSDRFNVGINYKKQFADGGRIGYDMGGGVDLDDIDFEDMDPDFTIPKPPRSPDATPIPEGMMINPVQTMEFRDVNQNGIEDREEGIYRESDFISKEEFESFKFPEGIIPRLMQERNKRLNQAQGGRIGFSQGTSLAVQAENYADKKAGEWSKTFDINNIPGTGNLQYEMEKAYDRYYNEFFENQQKTNKAQGGRIGFKEGGPPNPGRRNFLKLMGGLAALPVVGKFFKFAKPAAKVVQLKNTTTTMPAWFPKFVDKVMDKGVGTKIDADIMQYDVKELPGIKVLKHDDGRIYVEGQNDYYKNYDMEYQPPGYEVVDYTSGKTVKTKGNFTASEEVPVHMDPDGNVDFEGLNLERVDDILGSDVRVMEEFATGKKIKIPTRGESKVGQAEVAAENAADAAAEREAMTLVRQEPEDFASGGLAKLLGE